MNHIQVRLATLEDVDVIAYHRRAMFSATGHGSPADLEVMTDLFRPYLQRALAGGLYRGWLACAGGGQVVAGGGVIVHEWPARPGDPNTRRAYILNVYTEPAYRRQGIARRLVTAIVDWCRAEGLQAVSLHASADGRPLYESLGFTPTNEMRLRLK